MLFRAADLTVHPSASETLGLVGIESLSLGTPCLMSDSIGTCDVVRHGYNGWCIPTNSNADLYSWAEAIEVLAKNPQMLDYFKANSKFPDYIATNWREYGRMIWVGKPT